MGITRSECTFVALGTQHAMRKRRIAICGLSGCTIFRTISHKLQDFQKTSFIFYKNVCSDFL